MLILKVIASVLVSFVFKNPIENAFKNFDIVIGYAYVIGISVILLAIWWR